jgi:hypothetical protein
MTVAPAGRSRTRVMLAYIASTSIPQSTRATRREIHGRSM